MSWTCSNCHGPGTKAVWCTNCVRKDEARIRELEAELAATVAQSWIPDMTWNEDAREREED